MGSKFTDILTPKTIDPDYLRNKTVAVDAFNTLYTFLTTIRGRDGTPLSTSDGKPTSHVVGIFNRFTTFLENDTQFGFVFDGEPPALKQEERKRRRKRKEKAQKKYEDAKAKGDTKNMKKYAARTTFLTKDMQREAKHVIDLLGMTSIDAPSEGEAQAAHLTKNGDAFAVISQDADSLLNGATRVVRNLSISGKRKMPGQRRYTTVKPELYEYKRVLHDLDVSPTQLLALAMLVGTDYNYGGVKGIGPKRGIKLVKKHGDDLKAIFEDASWSEHFETPWQRVYETLKNIPVTDDYDLAFTDPKYDELRHELVETYEFSEERVEKTLKELREARDGEQQVGLNQYF